MWKLHVQRMFKSNDLWFIGKVLKVPLSVSVSLLLHEDICGSYTCKALSKTSDLWSIGKALKINVF